MRRSVQVPVAWVILVGHTRRRWRHEYSHCSVERTTPAQCVHATQVKYTSVMQRAATKHKWPQNTKILPTDKMSKISKTAWHMCATRPIRGMNVALYLFVRLFASFPYEFVTPEERKTIESSSFMHIITITAVTWDIKIKRLQFNVTMSHIAENNHVLPRDCCNVGNRCVVFLNCCQILISWYWDDLGLEKINL